MGHEKSSGLDIEREIERQSQLDSSPLHSELYVYFLIFITLLYSVSCVSSLSLFLIIILDILFISSK